MQSDHVSIALLASYVLVAVLLVLWNARACGSGWRAWLLYTIARLYCGLMFKWRAHSPCPLPRDSSALVVANHTSPVDPILIWMNHSLYWRHSRMRVIGFMTAREYCEMPGLVGWICRVMQSIPIERAGQDMGPAREALRRLRQGELVGVFPEGRLNPGRDLLPANPGVAWLALRSESPVYPVFVHNAPRGTNMVSSFYTPSRVRVSWGQPIDLNAWQDGKIDHDTLRSVSDVIMQRLAQLGGVDYSRPPASETRQADDS